MSPPPTSARIDERPRELRAAPEPGFVVFLHGLALAIAWVAVLNEISLPAGILGAVVGSMGAAMAGGVVARSRMRLYLVWLLLIGADFMGSLLAQVIVTGSTFPDLLGTRGALAASDAVRWTFHCTMYSLALRATTSRYRSFAVVELMLVAGAMAGVVAAHRDGAINQPRFLSDWAILRGHDPVNLLLLLGAGTVGTLIFALLRERRGRGWRVLLHLLALGAAALVVLLFHFVKLPTPPRGDGLGQSGKGKDERSGDRGGRGQKGGQGKSGGGSQSQIEQLEFKDDYNSSGQQSPVAVVILHDDYSPPLGYYYFRQTAFSQYNGHRLVAPTRDDMDRDIQVDFPTKPTDVRDAPASAKGPERKTIKSTVALIADHIHPFGLETPVAFAPRESPDPARFTRSYDVTSAALAMRYEDLLGKRTFANGWSDDLRRAYTELPDDKRYKELADRIVDTTLRPEYRQDPFAQAIAVSAWLSKNSIYSKKSQHQDAVDPTADFLFGDRIGYCVHFAHAAAFLLRARGLPARISGGYVADEGRKGSGSTIMLRQKDAHAWAELHLDGFGWIIVDVAPERTLDPPDTPADRDLQRMLGELARGQKPTPDKPKQDPDDPGSNVSAADVGRGLLGLLLLALFALYGVKLWRMLVPEFAGPRAIYRVAYRAALDRLAEVGLRREEGESREHFAARVAHVSPSLVAATRHHVGHAFGARRIAPPGEMRRVAFLAGAEAQRDAPWWRRYLAMIDPFSWMQSK